MKNGVWACVILIMAACHGFAADGKCKIEFQEKWSNVFAARDITFHVLISAPQAFSGRVGWQYACDGRTLSRGEKVVTVSAGKDETIEIRVQTPAVKDGVVLKTSLKISVLGEDGQRDVAGAEKNILVFPEDSFADRKEWLKQKKILLFDPDGKTAALFTKAGIPFKETRNLSALAGVKEGMIVIAEGISFKEYRGLPEAMIRAAASGTPVLCLAATGGEMLFPGMGASELPQPTGMIFKRNDAIRMLDKRLDETFWYPEGRAVMSTVSLKGARGPVSGEMMLDETGWPWVEINFGGRHKTLLVSGFGILKNWEEGPAPRYLLVKLLEHSGKDVTTQKGETDE